MMKRFGTRIQLFARIVLCAYLLLLVQEVVHHDLEFTVVASAELHDGAAHLAHGIISDIPACAVCQGAFSQIQTGGTRLTLFSSAVFVSQARPTLQPQLPTTGVSSPRAPPPVVAS